MLAPAIDTTFSEVLKLPEQSGRALASSAQVKILTVFVTESIKTWRSLGEANHIRTQLIRIMFTDGDWTLKILMSKMVLSWDLKY